MNTQKASTSQPSETIIPDTLLDASRRWHRAVPLRVAEGFDERFQPAGFPNLGPALYRAMARRASDAGAAAGNEDLVATDFLLVESAQSLANWMESVCLDPASPCRYNNECKGIPFIVVQETLNGKRGDLTSSLTEPHRLASDVILDGKLEEKKDSKKFSEVLEILLQVDKQRPVHLPKIAKRLFYLDPACLLHGVFLEKLDGRVRFPRLLSATITAKHPQPVNAGGVMRGYVTAAGKEASIPYPVQHFASPEIILHLTFHTDSLKGLGLDDEEKRFLAAFALYKVRCLLESFPRLRTACVLDADSVPDLKPNLSDAIGAAFTEERRRKVLDAVKHLPKPDDKGFEPFGINRS